jgi:hypothetical protein
MEPKFTMKTSTLPKMLADLSHSNQFLKVFSLGLTLLCALLIVLATIMSSQEPIVLAFGVTAQPLQEVRPPKPEDEIARAMMAYVEKRYNWEPANVVKNLKEAEPFVWPVALSVFRTAAANVARFSSEKSVTQKVYVEKPVVDLAKRTVSFTGDRVTSIQGMKVAGDLRLELSFESGPRTKENPWGVYVTKEREE